jgi:hypothetical protein
MVKNRRKKHIEAEFRIIRGNIVENYREIKALIDFYESSADKGLENKVFITEKNRNIECIKSLVQQLSNFPEDLQSNMFIGWVGMEDFDKKLFE